MLQSDFHVVRKGLEWAVSLHGVFLAAFETQRAAINRAIDAAHQVGMKGHKATVVLADDHASPRTHWVFGHHPYPPTA
ncbi:MAG: hypothetical protein K0R64_3154 [Novosphingobium lindaniclasticum]|jgi:hypothetical protein|uniref:DUF2188 domain-containing protein n=2 Tax=Novosphingobium TaxID=165696 RepID=T0HFZ8_9SPHN|nr:hypothetical protein [Novosphingobium lindaniclasticum]EQB15276.1 hypothetical protein L284_11615 [Novosphingobium lindaniclasticum LE124]MDF2640170.1 hypothetical protein [Novosphingobium lindaniclasticum]